MADGITESARIYRTLGQILHTLCPDLALSLVYAVFNKEKHRLQL